jgi:hypothetical protein
MRSSRHLLTLFVIIVTGIFFAGCSSYATPEISLDTSFVQVNASPETGNITYDVTVDLKNMGSNNAYDVSIMLLLSTPKDLANYRFVYENIDIGTIPKGETVKVTKRMELAMTKDNYDILSKNQDQPEVETKITKISSDIME